MVECVGVVGGFVEIEPGLKGGPSFHERKGREERGGGGGVSRGINEVEVPTDKGVYRVGDVHILNKLHAKSPPDLM